MDILSKSLDKAARENIFRPHPLCFDLLITHLSFTNDVLIFFYGSEQSLVGIINTLSDFHKVSGLALSVTKSCLFLAGNNQVLARALAAKFGLVQVSSS